MIHSAERWDLIKDSVILIADDIPENLEVLGNILKKNEFQVAIAVNGNQTIKVATTKLPDLILLDIAMPDIDGYQVCKILKGLPETRHIPIIFLTSKVDSADIIKGFEVGCVDYITKPFNHEELLARVFTHLELKKTKEDIILRKAIEAELREAKAKAEELNQFKSSLLGNMSHEFRTPLIGIIGYSQFLSEELQNEEHFHLVEAINQSGIRLLTTLNSLLRFSELEAGKLQATLIEKDLNKVTENILGYFATEAHEKNISLRFMVGEPVLHCLLDSTLFDQALIYIIDNAIKFTNEGSVSIETGKFVDEENRYWGKVSVIDTGIGIDLDNQDRIFEEFRQASEGTTRKFEGTGLGLTLAKKMIALMNGKINVSSKVGTGTTFTILLPAEKFD
ncbi:MAG: hybrid sensor histidine kinase/response regulator [Ignavibacteria bacterium]